MEKIDEKEKEENYKNYCIKGSYVEQINNKYNFNTLGKLFFHKNSKIKEDIPIISKYFSFLTGFLKVNKRLLLVTPEKFFFKN
jgi:hypothetical protein